MNIAGSKQAIDSAENRMLEHRIAWLKARIGWFGGEDEPWYRKRKAERKLAELTGRHAELRT